MNINTSKLERSVFDKVLSVEAMAIENTWPLNNLGVDCYVDYASNSLRTRLKYKLLSDNLDTFTTKVPLSAWEHLKLQYAPKWFLVKYPVQYKITEYRFSVMYPDYVLNKDQLGMGRVIFRKYK